MNSENVQLYMSQVFPLSKVQELKQKIILD